MGRGSVSTRYKQGPYEECWVPVVVEFNTAFDNARGVQPAGDPNWHDAHDELKALHVRKSATYGTDSDPLANFTEVAKIAGHDPERYVLLRIVEKCARALHMLDIDEAEAVKEYPDIASLALCGEALRRRRGNP